jgi:hypothetical protein
MVCTELLVPYFVRVRVAAGREAEVYDDERDPEGLYTRQYLQLYYHVNDAYEDFFPSLSCAAFHVFTNARCVLSA